MTANLFCSFRASVKTQQQSLCQSVQQKDGLNILLNWSQTQLKRNEFLAESLCSPL